MDKGIRKLTIGVQSFEKLGEEGYVYVDKTAYIYELIRNAAPYFMRRPRRFGKSLLITTLKAYFEGKRELFKGLEIERLTEGDPQAFEAHPVFHFDFNRANYSESIIDTDVNPKTGEREISSAVRRSVQSVQPSQRFCQRGIRLILVRVGNTHFPH